MGVQIKHLSTKFYQTAGDLPGAIAVFEKARDDASAKVEPLHTN